MSLEAQSHQHLARESPTERRPDRPIAIMSYACGRRSIAVTGGSRRAELVERAPDTAPALVQDGV